MTVVVDGAADVNLDTLRRVALGGEGVRVSERARRLMASTHDAFQRYVAEHGDDFIYMVTSGPGPDAGRRFDLDEARARRERRRPFLGLSFGGGTLPEYLSRGIVFAGLPLLVSGNAAAHPDRAVALAARLDGPLPLLPERGLVAAGELMPRFVLGSGGDGPIEGEGFSAGFANGAPAAAAMAGLAALLSRRRFDIAERCLALSVDAFRSPLDACDPELARLWADPFEGQALERLSWLLGGATGERRVRGPATSTAVPASYRILPRLLGQSRRALSILEEVAEAALGETASNPTFVHGAGDEAVISTGAFHNAAAAPAIDSVAASWADLALVAHRHVVKLHRGAVSGLPDRLLPPGTDATTGHSTTYLEYVPNQAVEEMRRLARPTLLAAGEVAASSQDDVAVTAPIAYLAEREVAIRLDEVLAVLALTCSQALHVAGRVPARRLADLLAFVRRLVPPVESRRELGSECGRLAESFSAAVEEGAPGSAGSPLSPD